MLRNYVTHAIVSGVLTFGSQSFADGTPSVDPQTAMSKAHEAYVMGDFARSLRYLKMVLSDAGDIAAKENSLELLKQIYRETEGSDALTSDFSLPEGVLQLNIDFILRKRPEETDYGLKVTGVTGFDPDEISDLKIYSVSGQILLDKGNRRGEWHVSSPANKFELADFSLQNKPVTGLYLVELKTKKVPYWQGWFILSNQISSETPQVEAPYVGQTYSTPQPIFRWTSFFSPEYHPTELRSLWMGIYSLKDHKPVDSVFKVHPTMDNYQVEKNLPKGKYRVHISYKEKRRFGPLWIGRISSTLRPFFIQG